MFYNILSEPINNVAISPAELFAAISAACSAISAICACISCILTFKNARPHLKIKFLETGHQSFYFNLDPINYAVLSFQISNTSSIRGMIDDIQIKYDKKIYTAEISSTDFQIPPGLEITVDNQDLLCDIDKLRKKTPISVDGFSIVSGFIFFPNFPVIRATSHIFIVRFRKSYNKRYSRKRVKFVTAPLALENIPNEKKSNTARDTHT